MNSGVIHRRGLIPCLRDLGLAGEKAYLGDGHGPRLSGRPRFRKSIVNFDLMGAGFSWYYRSLASVPRVDTVLHHPKNSPFQLLRVVIP
jgi:hypothetical protein